MQFLIFGSLITISLLIMYMLKEAFSNRVIEHKLYSKNLPASFTNTTLFFISDIHRRKISKILLNKINSKTDYILIGGDLAERFVPIKKIESNLKLLTSIAPVYFVWGNNDYEVSERQLIKLFKKYNVISLNNFGVKIKSAQDNSEIAFLGIKDRQFDSLQLWENDDRLQRALATVNDAPFKVLVCHKPHIIKYILPEHGIDLVLCGHTHGGQIHIFGYSPYPQGQYKEVAGLTILISNGYGTTCLPFRLGAKSETHLIHLLKH